MNKQTINLEILLDNIPGHFKFKGHLYAFAFGKDEADFYVGCYVSPYDGLILFNTRTKTLRECVNRIYKQYKRIESQID